MNMKKIKILALLATLILLGCSNEDLINTEQNITALEESDLTFSNGERKNNPNNGINSITFYSNSVNSNFVSGCLPTGQYLLQQGYFSGNLIGFGKLNTKLSTYEFLIPCKEVPSFPNDLGVIYMYEVVAQGKLALGSKDYCNITITGTIFPWYDNVSGLNIGTFLGSAITDSGVGKLKVLDNKNFQVSNGNIKDPSIILDLGTIRLRISEL